MKTTFKSFSEVWFVDFEFRQPSGSLPEVRCMAALEYHSGRQICLWAAELKDMDNPPFPIDHNSLYVAYYNVAEFNCHLALGWPLPVYTLDVCIEFKCLTSNRKIEGGKGLLGCAVYHGIVSMDAIEKKEMRELAMQDKRSGEYTKNEREELLAYNFEDVKLLSEILPCALKWIDFPRALLRGEYMKSVARIEHCGTPLDTETLNDLIKFWPTIKTQLIQSVDCDYGVCSGHSILKSKFKKYLIAHQIPWPLLPSGQIDTEQETLREMSKIYPQIQPLCDLNYYLHLVRPQDIACGPDGRNRTMLSAFNSATGRNQPSTTSFIVGLAVSIRGLIKPPLGYGLAYIDLQQQEFGIAAALSGDQAMIKSYESGDPYMQFCIQAGAAPKGATKATHGSLRDKFKQCVLATQYGQGSYSLANKINQSELEAKELLRSHREVYHVFWSWVEKITNQALFQRVIQTVFGWRRNTKPYPHTNLRSIGNFMMQAHGAEMLRLSCIYAHQKGINICAPVHDALLIEAPLEELNDAISITRECMRKASMDVLDGFEIRTEVEVFRYPERFMDKKRGLKMWNHLMEVLEKVKNGGFVDKSDLESEIAEENSK